MTNQNLDKARLWAETWSDTTVPANTRAAIDIIQSLPDRWVDVEKVREIIESKEGRPPATALPELLHDLRNLITPKLPTLADMTAEEREACKWMQCMIGDDTDDYCLLITVDTPFSRVIFQNGNSTIWKNDLITPLPDLPKLEWPGGEPVEKHGNASLDPQENFDASVEHVKTVQSSPEPKEDEVWIVEEEQGGRGVGRFAGKEDEFPWFILLDRGTYDNYKMGSVTPICRMVPETHILPEGMRLADHADIGRVVVSPYTNDDGVHRAYKLTDANIYGASLTLVHADDLTFLDGA
ncbi:hypothetical protein [Corynebacterium glutamicum]|uniref:hypothetical protein n=1 Tax=Corynebacterium glutamicum TaxID=1718 RepID=UPI00146623E9|nr:hypothetical protein [Corynebacterium glutamicum]GFK19304.1 hypothetical protein KbCgl_18760 [Corynebacterium glutamicum]